MTYIVLIIALLLGDGTVVPKIIVTESIQQCQSLQSTAIARPEVVAAGCFQLTDI